MSQHHYAYGPPEGYYQQPNPNPSLPYPAYGAPSYHPSSSGAVPPYSNGNASNQEFDHNRNMIPGLGLGFPNPAPEWRQQWTNPSAVAVPVQNSDPGMVSQGPGAAGPIVDNLASASRPTEPGVQNDNMDEGELSEGELEDIYEPKYPDEDLVPAGNNGSRNHALPTNGAAAVAQDPVPQDGLEAELSGE